MVSSSVKNNGTILAAMADQDLADQVQTMADTNPRDCMSCLTCSGGCPFFPAMDYGPHGIMRRIVLGLRDEVLASNTIWLCVGCQTCAALCPVAIDIPAIMDALRFIALEEGSPVAEPSILDFHREVLQSIERYGRTHKLEIMLRHKASQKSWFQDMDLGLKMLAKRKLDLFPSKVKNMSSLSKLFGKLWRR